MHRFFGDFRGDPAVDGFQEFLCLLKLVDVDTETRFWFLFFRKFGCGFHPMTMVQTEFDSFYPLLLVIILERNQEVSHGDSRGASGLIPSVSIKVRLGMTWRRL